jgi:hypothetical protein
VGDVGLGARSPATTAAFVERALGVLETEAPVAFHRLIDELRAGPAGLEVDEERFSIEVRGDALRVVRRPTSADGGRVRTGGDVVLDLIDGRVPLLEAVVEGRLDVRGDCDAVLRLARGLTAFVEGAVRSPGVRDLLEEYRAAVLARNGG